MNLHKSHNGKEAVTELLAPAQTSVNKPIVTAKEVNVLSLILHCRVLETALAYKFIFTTQTNVFIIVFSQSFENSKYMATFVHAKGE